MPLVETGLPGVAAVGSMSAKSQEQTSVTTSGAREQIHRAGAPRNVKSSTS
jgi:hypothetical protein